MTRIIGMCRRHPVIVCIIVIVLFVLAANAVYVFATNPDPLLNRSGLVQGSAGSGYVLQGLTNHTPLGMAGASNTIEINDVLSQGLGTQAAHQLLSGTLPVWNHFEGLGAPLAGDMQPAAMFVPFVFLLVLPGGWLAFHIVLEVVAALGTYALLRRLGFSHVLACVGGCMFAVNGTFAIITNAAFNPIAFLPWMLLGVEIVRENAIDRRKRGLGWVVLASAFAYSLYAGFPEVAFFDGILVAVWAITRIPRGRGAPVVRGYCVRVIVGTVAGAALAAPQLWAFVTYIRTNPYMGLHESSYVIAGKHVPWQELPRFFFPYIFGTLNSANNSGVALTQLAGFASMLVLMGAVWGLFNRRFSRWTRWLLVGFALLGITRIFGLFGVASLLAKVPGLARMEMYRYVEPAVMFALIGLFCCGLEHVQLAENWRRSVAVSAGICAGVAVSLYFIAIARNRGSNMKIDGFPHHEVLWFAIPVAAGILITLAALWRQKLGTVLLACLVLVEGVVYFAVPQMSAIAQNPTPRVDMAAINFLRDNLGTGRFVSENVLPADIGSYYGLAQINVMNLPVPRLTANYMTTFLDPHANATAFYYPWDTATILDNIDGYEAAGVSYLVLTPHDAAANKPALNAHGLSEKYSDGTVAIYALPNPAQYWTAPGCTTTSNAGRDSVTLTCHATSTLTRLEIAMPGWTASINGHSAAITADETYRTFQTVEVPAGKSVIAFEYWPDGLTEAFVVWALAVSSILGAILLATAAKVRKRKPHIRGEISDIREKFGQGTGRDGNIGNGDK